MKYVSWFVDESKRWADLAETHTARAIWWFLEGSWEEHSWTSSADP